MRLSARCPLWPNPSLSPPPSTHHLTWPSSGAQRTRLAGTQPQGEAQRTAPPACREVAGLRGALRPWPAPNAEREARTLLSLRQPHHPPRGQIPRLATPPAPGPHFAAAADCLPPRSLDLHTSRHRKDALASLFPQAPKLPPAGCTGGCLTQYLGPWDHATVACLSRPGTGTKSESESEAGAASTGVRGAGLSPAGSGESPPRGWGAGAGKPAGRVYPVFPGQFSSVAQSCQTLCDPRDRSTPGLPVHHQLPEFIQSHVHRVGDATRRQGLTKK